ncbi:Os01g0109000, partial [Oryza sativa Japonica Group]
PETRPSAYGGSSSGSHRRHTQGDPRMDDGGNASPSSSLSSVGAACPPASQLPPSPPRRPLPPPLPPRPDDLSPPAGRLAACSCREGEK